MAKLDRKDVKIFAENSNSTLITEFRTEDETEGTASYSRDPDIIQNANYSQGWVDNTNNLNTKIYGEDLNAVSYVISYLLKYLYENGIAEWKSSTTYYEHSICKVNDVLYISLQDDNTGNDPTNTVGYWRAVVLDTITSVLAGSGANIIKSITGNEIKIKSLTVDGYGSLQDDGDNINIHILGGSGVVDAYWGQIQGTISNQTDLSNALVAKQDVISCSSPLTLDVNNNISIPKATLLTSGYLGSEDFTSFYNKQSKLNFNMPLTETSGDVTISKANNSTSGYLDYNDWNTFNNKQDTLSFSSPLSKTSNTISISQANTSTSGYLSNTDWNTFNNKQNTITASSPLSLSSNTLTIKKADSNNSGYLSNTDWNTFNNKTSANNGSYSIKMNGVTKGTVYANGTGTNTIDLGTIITSTNDCAKLASQNRFTTTNFFQADLYLERNNQNNVVLQNNSSRPRFAYTLDGTGYACVATKTAWNFASDIRLKKNIKTIDNALSVVENINPVKFDFKDDQRNDSYETGFIAQEIQEIIPQAITEDENGYLSLGMNSIIPYLAGAIKELNSKVKTLEKEVVELKGQNK